MTGATDMVCLRPPDVEAVLRAPKSPDVAHTHERWLARSASSDDVRYFSVYEGAQLVGQIFLHDINWQIGEALVGYHLFETPFRGRGIGTRALALLQQYVIASTSLRRLIVIPATKNHASRRIAEKCGFTIIGPAREGPEWIVLRWELQETVASKTMDSEKYGPSACKT